MLHRDKLEVCTIEELISSLEPIECGEICSDITANARAELKRMKRNISLILAFVSSPAFQPEPEGELKEAITSLRRECVAINGSISKTLILQTLRFGSWSEHSAQITEQYATMREKARAMCNLAAPTFAHQISAAL